MFTILDGINRFLSYLNINVKAKNRTYLIVGIISNAYIGYLIYQFLSVHSYVQAIIYSLILIVLIYFWITNFIFYFYDRNVKWDISPWVEKKLAAKELENAAKKDHLEIPTGKDGSHLVIYDKQEVTDQGLISEVSVTPEGQKVLSDLVQYFRQQTVQNIGKQKKIKEKTYSLGKKLLVPSSTIEEEEGRLALYIGLNAIERKRVGYITKIAEVDTAKMQSSYAIFPANVYITGGDYKMPGRRKEILQGFDPYQIHLEVLYEAKI